MRESGNEILRIRRCWNAGDTLSEASKRMRKLGFTDTRLLITEWRKMKKLFRCRSAPAWYVNGWREPSKAPVYAEAKLSALVGPPGLYGSGTYGDWAGITGPGKRLREILKGDGNAS